MTNMRENTKNIRYKWENVKEMSFEERPTIPKVRKSRQVEETINLLNQAIRKIKDEMESPMNLKEINHLIYSASTTIAKTIGEKVKT